MKNHLNILPKLASFNLKSSKMRWRLGLRPSPRWGSLRRSPSPPNRKRQRAFGARHSLFRVHFYISIPLSAPPYGIPGSATDCCFKFSILLVGDVNSYLGAANKVRHTIFGQVLPPPLSHIPGTPKSSLRDTPVSTGILPHSLPEWAFRARPGLWRNCLCPKVARIAEQKFGSVRAKLGQRSCFLNGPQIWCPIGQ